jgi:adenosylmethionine-8-amino-7-oxononanoate aminotransferase
MRALGERLGAHPHVGNVRGRGLFVGVEMVESRETKTPFDPRFRLNARIKAQAMSAGLLVYPMGGTVDGQHGDHVLLAPPFIVSASEVQQIADLLSLAIDRAIESTRSPA